MMARAWKWDRERPASGDFYMVHFTSRDRAISEGGYQSMPEAAFPGGEAVFVCTDDAGILGEAGPRRPGCSPASIETAWVQAVMQRPCQFFA